MLKDEPTQVLEAKSEVECTENVPSAPSPIVKKFIEEDTNAQTIEGVVTEGSTPVEQNQPTRSEKLSLEEGFCCVSEIMSFFLLELYNSFSTHFSR